MIKNRKKNTEVVVMFIVCFKCTSSLNKITVMDLLKLSLMLNSLPTKNNSAELVCKVELSKLTPTFLLVMYEG